MAWSKALYGLLVLILQGTVQSRTVSPSNSLDLEHILQSDTLIPVKVEQLSPIYRQDAKRIRLFFGPLNILGKEERKTAASKPGAKLTDEGMTFDRSMAGFCKNCMVLSGKADLNFLNGTRATISHGVYNHHLVILDREKRTLPWYLCTGQSDLGSTQSAGFMITGVAEATNYYSAPNSPVKAGFWIGPEQSKIFRLNAELINYRDHTVPVYVTTEIEYLNGWPKDYVDASMSLLSVTGCKAPHFQVPHDKTHYNFTSPTARIPKDGYIVATTGHVHDGGVHITLNLNGKVVCDSYAVYGGIGNQAVGPDGRPWETISSMTECNDPIRVKAGDVVSTTAVYDTTAHALRHSASGHGDGDSMGVFFINFAPSP